MVRIITHRYFGNKPIYNYLITDYYVLIYKIIDLYFFSHVFFFFFFSTVKKKSKFLFFNICLDNQDEKLKKKKSNQVVHILLFIINIIVFQGNLDRSFYICKRGLKQKYIDFCIYADNTIPAERKLYMHVIVNVRLISYGLTFLDVLINEYTLAH